MTPVVTVHFEDLRKENRLNKVVARTITPITIDDLGAIQHITDKVVQLVNGEFHSVYYSKMGPVAKGTPFGMFAHTVDYTGEESEKVSSPSMEGSAEVIRIMDSGVQKSRKTAQVIRTDKRSVVYDTFVEALDEVQIVSTKPTNSHKVKKTMSVSRKTSSHSKPIV